MGTKTIFALNLLSIAALALAFYSIFWIAWDIAWNTPQELFLLQTFGDWLMVVIWLTVAALLSTIAANPQLMHYFSHIERGKGKSQRSAATTAAVFNATLPDSAAIQELMKRNPNVAAAINKDPEALKELLGQTTQPEE